MKLTTNRLCVLKPSTMTTPKSKAGCPSQIKEFRYHLFTDCIDCDDDGEEQASIYSQSIDSLRQLTPAEAVELAEEEADWKIAFGQGDWELIGTYTIEEETRDGNLRCIAENYSP